MDYIHLNTLVPDTHTYLSPTPTSGQSEACMAVENYVLWSILCSKISLHDHVILLSC